MEDSSTIETKQKENSCPPESNDLLENELIARTITWISRSTSLEKNFGIP